VLREKVTAARPSAGARPENESNESIVVLNLLMIAAFPT
jgi:hypothetical protein